MHDNHPRMAGRGNPQVHKGVKSVCTLHATTSTFSRQVRRVWLDMCRGAMHTAWKKHGSMATGARRGGRWRGGEMMKADHMQTAWKGRQTTGVNGNLRKTDLVEQAVHQGSQKTLHSETFIVQRAFISCSHFRRIISNMGRWDPSTEDGAEPARHQVLSFNTPPPPDRWIDWAEVAEVVKISLPVVGTYLLQSAFGIVTVTFTGRLGVDALAGATLGMLFANLTGPSRSAVPTSSCESFCWGPRTEGRLRQEPPIETAPLAVKTPAPAITVFHCVHCRRSPSSHDGMSSSLRLPLQASVVIPATPPSPPSVQTRTLLHNRWWCLTAPR